MGAETQAACQCCDRPLTLTPEAVRGMRVPMVFCFSCFLSYDLITLRQWYKLDVLLKTAVQRWEARAAS